MLKRTSQSWEVRSNSWGSHLQPALGTWGTWRGAPPKCRFCSKWGAGPETLPALHALGRGLPLVHRPR